MTNKLTKEQYEKLEPYKQNIRNAVKNAFVHMSGADFLKVADIYADVFGIPLTKSQIGCNTCRLNALRKLGELYVEYEKKEEDKKSRYLRREFSYTKFQQTLILPEDVVKDTINASMNDGVLNIELPRKTPEAKSNITKVIEIK